MVYKLQYIISKDAKTQVAWKQVAGTQVAWKQIDYNS